MIRCRKKRRFDGLEQFIYLPFVDGHQRRFSKRVRQPFPRCRQFRTVLLSRSKRRSGAKIGS